MPTITRFRRELLPPARAFYEAELGKLSRPNRKGWALGRCPFHKSKSGRSLSVNLVTGAWVCFAGCGKGDIVGFVMLRDGLSFKDAAKLLGAWDGSLRLDAVVIRQVETERQRQEQEKAEREREHRELIRARTWLHRIERIYHEAIEGLRPDDEVGWAIAALAFDEVRDAEAAYMQKAGLS